MYNYCDILYRVNDVDRVDFNVTNILIEKKNFLGAFLYFLYFRSYINFNFTSLFFSENQSFSPSIKESGLLSEICVSFNREYFSLKSDLIAPNLALASTCEEYLMNVNTVRKISYIYLNNEDSSNVGYEKNRTACLIEFLRKKNNVHAKLQLHT